MFFILVACKEEYQPAVTQQVTNYLAVEGIINPDSTTVMLSRTRPPNDTTALIPEPGAVVYIEGAAGTLYLMTNKNNGAYTTGRLPLNLTDRYRLRITVSSKQYVSEYV